MKNLYKFYVNCGRMGDLDGLFIAYASDVERAMGVECWFYEVLGKHSEFNVELGPDNITLISNDQDKVQWLNDIAGVNLGGVNPFDHLLPEEFWEEDDAAITAEFDSAPILATMTMEEYANEVAS